MGWRIELVLDDGRISIGDGCKMTGGPQHFGESHGLKRRGNIL